jgi:hypothetical protein
MSENAGPSRKRSPVDGALYAILDGGWTKVGFAADPNDPDTTPFSLPEGRSPWTAPSTPAATANSRR